MKILITTDGSASSQNAIEEFCRMFEKAHHVDIKIASIYQALISLDAFGKVAESNFGLPERAEQAIIDAQKYIRERIPQAKIETIKSTDLPELFINETATGWSPNLIVVGTQEREFWSKIMFCSFSDATINTAPYSTLLARQKLRSLN